MCTGLLALAMFTWILDSESAGERYRKTANAPSAKNRGSVNGSDCDLSGDAGGFCQRSAFRA